MASLLRLAIFVRIQDAFDHGMTDFLGNFASIIAVW
jgi:hypothetical protein